MKLLFICTHNRCRSILAEAITNHLSCNRFFAASAGSQPSGEIHPNTIKCLENRGIETLSLKSQSWDDYADLNPDAILYMCDNAANEPCPIWARDSIRIDWGVADPSKVRGTEDYITQAFASTADIIESRIKRLLELNFEAMDTKNLTRTLTDIGTLV